MGLFHKELSDYKVMEKYKKSLENTENSRLFLCLALGRLLRNSLPILF